MNEFRNNILDATKMLIINCRIDIPLGRHCIKLISHFPLSVFSCVIFDKFLHTSTTFLIFGSQICNNIIFECIIPITTILIVTERCRCMHSIIHTTTLVEV
eukprot:531788_1